jgi:hypothetical protein
MNKVYLLKIFTELNHNFDQIAGNPFTDSRGIDDDITQEIDFPKDLQAAAKYVTVHCWPWTTGLC